MPVTVQFDRVYADFGGAVRDFEKSQRVIREVEHILYGTKLGYTLADLLGARFLAEWLREGDPPSATEDARDLIWEFADQGFFEIVLHDDDGHRNGGWLAGAEPVEIADEVVNDFHVIFTAQGGGRLRHEYLPEANGYEPQFGMTPAPLATAQRIARRRAGHAG